MIKALKINCNHTREVIDIPNELHDLQKAVGGNIECIALKDGGLMIVDEEDMLKQYPRNELASIICGNTIAGGQIYGTALIVGVDGEEFDDVPQQYIDAYMIDT